MKKLSQKELCSESIWNKLKSPIMAASAGIAKTMEYVAPELTNPINKLGDAVVDVKNSVQRGWHGVEGNIKKVLEAQGYKVTSISKMGKHYVAVVNEINYAADGTQSYDKNSKRLVVDENGHRMNTRQPNTSKTPSKNVTRKKNH